MFLWDESDLNGHWWVQFGDSLGRPLWWRKPSRDTIFNSGATHWDLTSSDKNGHNLNNHVISDNDVIVEHTTIQSQLSQIRAVFRDFLTWPMLLRTNLLLPTSNPSQLGLLTRRVPIPTLRNLGSTSFLTLAVSIETTTPGSWLALIVIGKASESSKHKAALLTCMMREQNAD